TVSDGDGEPVEGAHVSLNGDSFAVDTHDDGGYELCASNGRDETVEAGGRGLGTTIAAVKIAGRTRVDFTLGAAAVLARRVLRSEDGEPAAGAWVHAHAVGDSERWAAQTGALTDGGGRFRLTSLRPGRMRVQVLGERVVTTDYQEVFVDPAAPKEVEI